VPVSSESEEEEEDSFADDFFRGRDRQKFRYDFAYANVGRNEVPKFGSPPAAAQVNGWLASSPVKLDEPLGGWTRGRQWGL